MLRGVKMQSKLAQALCGMFLFFGVISFFLFWALIPRFFGKPYLLKIENPKSIDLPFGNYLYLSPTTSEMTTNPNQIPCKNLFSSLIQSGNGYILNGHISCTPPQDAPYLKGEKTPYGISFRLGGFSIPKNLSEELKEIEQKSNLMARLYLYDGRVSFGEIIY